MRGQTQQEPPVQDGYAFSFAPVRWHPYKPASQQFKRGIKGRWQAMNEYGGWENCEAPGYVLSEDQVKEISRIAREMVEGSKA